MNTTAQKTNDTSAEQDVLKLGIETFEIDELSQLDVNAAEQEIDISLCSSTCSSCCG